MASVDNKRIAKNTIYLYFRMILVMGVTLYTSRIVLKALGIDNFGIYNVVGGVVVLFSFLKGSITTAIQRYLNYALGRGDLDYEQKVFSTSVYILLFISLIIFIILETVGLWFINTQLTLPPDSQTETNIVYQLSILTFIFNIIRVPYDSLIMAHERMSFYAYISILEAVLKLAVAFMLLMFMTNKLILYAFLVLTVTILIDAIYLLYCKRRYSIRTFGFYDSNTRKELTSFSGWNIFGGIADMGYQQGTNIILNIFFGVAYNATMGITNQVKNAVFSFVRNLLTASNPQIFKLHASGDTAGFQKLILRVSKLAFFLFLFIAVPLIFNMNYILYLWLSEVPPMTALFCILTIIFCMIDSLIGPLWTAAQAYGSIKKYQILSSTILLLNLPFTYISYKLGQPPYSLLVIQCILVIVSLIYRVAFLSEKNLISIRDYSVQVIAPITIVVGIVFIGCHSINHFIPYDGLKRLLINTPLYVFITTLSIWFIGFSSIERSSITGMICNKLKLCRK